MKYTLMTTKGKEGSDSIELNELVWSVPANHDLVAQALYIYHANSRKGTAHAKTRAEVSGGGAKPWKQKGTGRARQGSIRSPLWTKGGVAFPPISHKSLLSLNKRMKHKAISCVLSDHLREKSVVILGDLNAFSNSKTKEALALLKDLGLSEKKVLIITNNEDGTEKLVLSTRNVDSVKVCSPVEVNIYDIAGADVVLTVPAAVNVLEKRLLQN